MTRPLPYKNDSFNKIYDILFCDQPELYRPARQQATEYPWNVLFAESPDADALNEMIEDEQLESRVKLLAYRLLADIGQPAAENVLLGVIVEVGLEGGLDVLAAYQDGTARYINHAEKIIIWDAPDKRSQPLINGLFAQSLQVVNNIGPWDKERLSPPAEGDIRLTFLVSGDIYFGQGPFDVLAKDAMGGPVIHAATQLMIYLTEVRGN